MSKFSQKFSEHIKRSKQPISSLAALCGITRQVIHYYMSGARVPPNYEIIDRVAKALNLSPSDEEELNSLYLQLKNGGDELYAQRMKVCEFLNNTRRLSLRNEDDKLSTNLLLNIFSDSKDTFMVRGQYSVYASIKSAVYEAVNGLQEMRMIAQPNEDLIINCFSAVKNKSDFTLTHIFCFDNSKHSSDYSTNNLNNIDLFGMIMPLLISKCRYIPRVYYQNLSSHINNMSVLPNVFITERCVICASVDYEYAVIQKSSEAVEAYKRIFCEQFEHTAELLEKKNSKSASSEMDATKLYGAIPIIKDYYVGLDISNDFLKNTSDNIISLGTTPILQPFITKEDFDDYSEMSADENSLVMEYIDSFRKRIESIALNGRSASFIYTIEGIERVLNEGRACMLPPTLYKPFSRERSKLFLRQNFEAAQDTEDRKSFFHPCIVNPLKLNYINGLFIDVSYSPDSLMFFIEQQGIGNNVGLVITDHNIYSAIKDFVTYLPNSDLVFNREETMEILRRSFS